MDKILLYSFLDFVLAPFYIAIIFFFANNYKNKKIATNPIYKYYVRGLQLKIIGAIGFFAIYVFYYGGGDTTAFFQSSGLLTKLFMSHPYQYFSIMFGNLSEQNLSAFFNAGLCCPQYYKDFNTFAIVRYVSPIVAISGFSYISSTIIFSYLTYICIWRLFIVFNELYPNFEKKLAIAILYLPTPIFWGSGILKDSLAFAGACIFTYSIYVFFIKKEKKFKYIFLLIMGSYIMVSLKPYIFVALLPGAAAWIFFNRIAKIQSTAVKLIAAPIIIGIGLLLTSVIMSRLKSSLGAYGDIDTALKKAQVSKFDLQRKEYGTNSFNIGEFDGSIGSAARLFPAAIIAGLYRPFVFEARNLVNFLTALENLFILILTLRVMLKTGPFRMIKNIFSEPLILYSFLFSVFFAFAVGLSTSNFGALARYKIPAIPFFVAMLFILEYKKDETKDIILLNDDNKPKT